MIPLDRRTDLVSEISLPTEKPSHVPTYIPITSEWKLVVATPTVRIWENSLPVRPRSLFFRSPPSGMELRQRKSQDQNWKKAKKRTHDQRMSKTQRKNTWAFTSKSLLVRRSPDEGPPQSWEYALSYTKAKDRETSLRIYEEEKKTREEQTAQIFRSQQVEDRTRHGIYLPAPSSIAYKLTVPLNGVLTTDAQIIPPEAADPAKSSDGVRLKIWIDQPSNTVLFNEILHSKDQHKLRFDLQKYAGKEIKLHFKSFPVNNASFDYLFLAEPIVYSPQKNPERIIMVFIDTLRADAMSMYGYERQTTPLLDAWAKDAAIFTQARSIAPWTLPSARTMVTGYVPEKWKKVPTIQQQFATNGWSTIFLAGNIYLSSTFGLADDWGEHRCINWPRIDVQIDRAYAYLDEHNDRPVLMMLHIMDMHLPYTEPSSYRYLFAGDPPKEAQDVLLGDTFNRSQVLKAIRKGSKEEQEQTKQYVRDRYDNNLKYIDDALTPFLKNFTNTDRIFIFADHGEEFWDHDDFEHGHTFFDEVIRVPFIAKTPDIDAGVYDHPISLLDLTPTVANSGNVSIASTEGWPLQELENHDFYSRPQAIGRVLYGDDGWASLYQGEKYITRAGKEESYNLKKDPTETKDISKDNDNILRGRAALSEALDTPVKEGFRLYVNKSRLSKTTTIEITSPSGFENVWQGSDPTQRAKHKIIESEDSTQFEAKWYSKQSRKREVFFVPNIPPQDFIRGLSDEESGIKMNISTTKKDAVPAKQKYNNLLNWPYRKALYKASVGGTTVTLSYAVMPLPKADAESLDAFDDEVSAELKVLGYVEE